MLKLFYKPRKKSSEFLKLRSLHARMELPERSRQYDQSMTKGYEGELLFDSFTSQLECNCIILNDLLLKSGNTTCQIDSMIITSDIVYMYEIKNYHGDYYYDTPKDKFYKIPDYEIINPLHQLFRGESLIN